MVVGISFRRVGKVYYFDPGELVIREGDFVIAETARGIEFGEVMMEPHEIPETELVAPLKKVIRVATGDDLERAAANREDEKRAYDVCQRKIAEHELPMKLLEAEYGFDGSMVTFSFSAEGRVDFRELVKDLASALKTKVQLHQIGVRDEAKLIGGYGTCGRELCCTNFLSNFDPISMKMAKDQSLFLNPAKFSGVCGKLMCCLRYEHEFYKDAHERLPTVGALVPTERGIGKIVDINVISGMLTVETEGSVILNIPSSSIDLKGCCRRHGCGCPMTESNCKPIKDDSVVQEQD
jgi:cell fate regulator YaaT (PSP1 superfamily)